MEVATAFVTIRPETSGFESELASALGGVPDQDVTLTADADTSAAEEAIESVPDGDVEVTANTDQAEAALDQVSQKVAETTDATSALGEAATGALGGMGGLGGAAGGAAQGLGASAVAGGAAAAGLFSFAQAAIDAESAGQRFQLITGPLGDELADIDVGGLSGDIGELALQLGSSDEAMLNATASFVTFGESTGASSDQIVVASDNINALARIASDYGHVYMATVAYGAKDVHTLKAFHEAESHDGPSLIVAYSPCIAHGVDMLYNQRQQDMAVKSGHWPLFRYDPRLEAAGSNPFKLDSAPPSQPIKTFMGWLGGAESNA